MVEPQPSEISYCQSASSVFNWATLLWKQNSGDKCSIEMPFLLNLHVFSLGPRTLIWGSGAAFRGFIICFASQRRAVLLRLQGSGEGMRCVPRGLRSSFIKDGFLVNCFPEQERVLSAWWGWLPTRKAISLCICLHFPWWWCPAEVPRNGGDSTSHRPHEEQGRERVVGRLRHCRVLCAGNHCPIAQDKIPKPKSILPGPAWGSQARQCSVKNFKLNSIYLFVLQ